MQSRASSFKLRISPWAPFDNHSESGKSSRLADLSRSVPRVRFPSERAAVLREESANCCSRGSTSSKTYWSHKDSKKRLCRDIQGVAQTGKHTASRECQWCGQSVKRAALSQGGRTRETSRGKRCGCDQLGGTALCWQRCLVCPIAKKSASRAELSEGPS